jgi:hypothetical protein
MQEDLIKAQAKVYAEKCLYNIPVKGETRQKMYDTFYKAKLKLLNRTFGMNVE